MGKIDDLLGEVSDPHLQKNIRSALGELKRQKRFGLVFEEHIPETTALFGLPIQKDSFVQRRDDEGGQLYQVINLKNRNSKAVLISLNDNKEISMATKDLFVVKQFNEPIYPAFSSLGSIKRDQAKPFHSVINGENFHTLQLMQYLYQDTVDCIYIDPPYNTGARDWKYNNRYVDSADSWRHSKWLSFMEKRLQLSKNLLKHDGVLIVTIDEHEVHHLGMLLEKIFPEYLRYMITVMNNPKGTGKSNFSRVEEYVFFVVPDIGYDIIQPRPSDSLDSSIFDEGYFENTEENNDDGDDIMDDDLSETDILQDSDVWEYRHARRRGTESSYRHQRHNQFYPIFINEKNKKVIRTGKSIPLDEEPNFSKIKELRPIWPIDAEGHHRVWGFISEKMQSRIDGGHVFLGKYNHKLDSWTINYRVPKKKTRKIKTIWINKAYDAGTHGTGLLRKLLGAPGLFQFPKSVYAVRDCLAAVVRNKPNALIVDFFAGSGTTFHATALLNSQDNGRRRTILVTNNEVSQKTSVDLNKNGIFKGERKFEKHGIFEQVTKPRCEAVIKGADSKGVPIPGNHLDEKGLTRGRPFSLGFDENVEFFNLVYLDPDDVDLGHQFNSILPSLWMAAGSQGERNIPKPNADFLVSSDLTYGILFKESKFQKFKNKIKNYDSLTHVWMITDSEEAYAEMRSELPKKIKTSMLYRDYLLNFKINGVEKY